MPIYRNLGKVAAHSVRYFPSRDVTIHNTCSISSLTLSATRRLGQHRTGNLSLTGPDLSVPAPLRLYSSAAQPAHEVADEATNKTETQVSLPESLRRLLRHLTNSVVVCTAAADDGLGAVAPVGLTMSSFTSLSLYPSPVVTFNIAMPSRTEAAISRTRQFMIHMLSGDSQGAKVADLFRTGNSHPEITAQSLKAIGCRVVHQQPSTTPPFLKGPGILHVLHCGLLEEPSRGLIAVRDHIIVLAQVLNIIKGEMAPNDSQSTAHLGLVYADRHYRQPSAETLGLDTKKT